MASFNNKFVRRILHLLATHKQVLNLELDDPYICGMGRTARISDARKLGCDIKRTPCKRKGINIYEWTNKQDHVNLIHDLIDEYGGEPCGI